MLHAIMKYIKHFLCSFIRFRYTMQRDRADNNFPARGISCYINPLDTSTKLFLRRCPVDMNPSVIDRLKYTYCVFCVYQYAVYISVKLKKKKMIK